MSKVIRKSYTIEEVVQTDDGFETILATKGLVPKIDEDVPERLIMRIKHKRSCLLRKMAETRYSRKCLNSRINESLLRADGNLRDIEKRKAIYDALCYFNYRCPYSNIELIQEGQKLAIDHVIPVTMGGTTDDWNCLPVSNAVNCSKKDFHLLDWWDDDHEDKDEYKLVRIYEYMARQILKTDEPSLKTEHAIVFLHQLLKHIEGNKNFIFATWQLIAKNTQEAIDKKMKDLDNLFEQVYNKMQKIDKSDLEDRIQVLNLVKKLGVRSCYKISNLYYAEIRELKNNGATDDEILHFCFSKEERFNYPFVLKKTKEYVEKYGGFDGITEDPEIGKHIDHLREAKLGREKGGIHLTKKIEKLFDDIGFPWRTANNNWFDAFFAKLVEYKDKEIVSANGKIKKAKGAFEGVTQDPEIGDTVAHIRAARKGKGTLKLTQEMQDKLDSIGFPWVVEYDWFEEFFVKVVAYRDKEIIGKNGKIKKEIGSFDGITQDPEIGNTVKAIRNIKKYTDLGIEVKHRRKLTEEMMNRLDSVGFTWSVRIPNSDKELK